MSDDTIHVEYVDFEEVKEWPRNPKDHDLHEIRKSFTRFGFIKPILLDEGTGQLVAGHGRLDTLRLIMSSGGEPPRGVKVENGSWLVPVLRGVKFKDPQEAEAFLLADNRLSEIGGWKNDLLSEMIKELGGEVDLLFGTGFDIDDFIPADSKLELEDINENKKKLVLADESQEIWEVKEGDIWKIGNQTVMCGDSTNRDDVRRLLGGNQVRGIITSPPYAERRKDTYGGVHQDDYVEWFKDVQSIFKEVIQDTGHFFLNINTHSAESGKYKYQKHPYVNELVFRMQTEWDWCFIDEYCWPHMVPPRRVDKKFRNSWESIYWFTKQTDYIWYPEAVKGNSDTAVRTREESWGKWSKLQGAKKIFVPRGEPGETYPSNVLYLGRVVDSRHPAQFPLLLPTFFMTACSKELEEWYDPFCGGGTVLFAAESINRIGYGMEKTPKYVALILQIATEKELEVQKIEE